MYFLQSNQNKLLNNLNPVLVVTLAFSVMLARTAWLPVLPYTLQAWDVLLPFTVFFSQRRSVPEGIVLCLFTSHLFSLLSTAPIGVFTVHYLVLFGIARLFGYGLYASASFSVIVLLTTLSVASRVLLPLIAGMFSRSWSMLSLSNFPIIGLLATVCLGYPIYQALLALDRLTSKAPIETIELSGDQ